MSVAESFQTLLSRIAPFNSEIEAVESHIATIRSRIESGFNVRKLFVTGSAARGSFIRGKSDVDLFVVVARDDLRRGGHYISSTTALDNVRKELEGRFRNTPVYKDVHAVVVDFLDCRMDVVPAFFAGTADNNWPLYSMPDGQGRWMQTSPGLHNAYIARADKESGGKLKYTAQLMKLWRECRNPRIPISSFHIEMLLASEGICKGAKSYADCVRDLMQSIVTRECRAIRDPRGVTGNIPCVKTESQRISALASVKHSRDHANSACNAERVNVGDAKRQWDIVFNQNFPR